MKTLLLLFLPFAAFAQTTTSSVEAVMQPDSTWKLQSEVAFDDGSSSTWTSAPMTSGAAGAWIQSLYVNGGTLGSLRITGQREMTRHWRAVMLENQVEREAKDLKDAYLTTTGADFDTAFVAFNDQFLGEWTLTTPDPLNPTYDVTISRRPNGKLLFRAGLLNGLLIVKDEDHGEVRNLGTIPTLQLIRVDAGRRRFRSVDRLYTLIPK